MCPRLVVEKHRIAVGWKSEAPSDPCVNAALHDRRKALRFSDLRAGHRGRWDETTFWSNPYFTWARSVLWPKSINVEI